MQNRSFVSCWMVKNLTELADGPTLYSRWQGRGIAFSLPPIPYHYSRTTDSLGQVHRTETNKWRMSHESRFSRCDSKSVFGILHHGFHRHWQEVFGSWLPAVLQMVATTKNQVHDSPIKPSVEKACMWGKYQRPPADINFASVEFRYLQTTSLLLLSPLNVFPLTQFTYAVHRSTRISNIKTVLPENLQRPEERLTNNFLVIIPLVGCVTPAVWVTARFHCWPDLILCEVRLEAEKVVHRANNRWQHSDVWN